MRYLTLYPLSIFLLFGCVSDAPYNGSADYEELDSATMVDAPDPVPGNYHPGDRDTVERGAYLIELLGCGSCHTNGAFEGAPELDKALAGSNTGIAFSNPVGDKYPGVIYPSNITPDTETGIGDWSDRQIASTIRAGIGRHGNRPGGRRIVAMPWPGYSKLTDDDVDALVSYLRSIKPIRNIVPKEVSPGQPATAAYVYFGVYRSKQ